MQHASVQRYRQIETTQLINMQIYSTTLHTELDYNITDEHLQCQVQQDK